MIKDEAARLGFSACGIARVEPVEAEMRRHGYRLQYLLYLVAVTRFVATRGGMRFNEAYEKVGGVFYVFLRGINRDGTRGIVRERPPLELMTALDAFFKGAAVH